MPEKTVILEKDGRIGRVILNRPEVLNAIDDRLPHDLAAAVDAANLDDEIHVIILSGRGKAFCSGYQLKLGPEATEAESFTQEMPWDPMKDYRMMKQNTELFMKLWRCDKPVICKVHGAAVAAGSDIALSCDLIVMAEDAQIGYMPARVWGCPTTAMWVYRVGAQNAKRMLFTGDKITGVEAKQMGLALDAVPSGELDARVDELANRIAGVPRNQLMMQKLMINQALDAMGLENTQMMATLFDGIARHSPEGLNFKNRAEEKGWKQAVQERDQGTYDWARDEPMPPEGKGG